MFDDAITYAERHTLHALIIAVDGRIVVARTGIKRDLEDVHALYSGSKSFWGIAAVAAVEDGLLDLDEPLGRTIGEWPATSPKWTITARQLLTLTAGYGFGGIGNAVPAAARALEIPLRTEPGSTFTYGGVPLQVFGEVLRRKIAARYCSPHAYLTQRILEPIGMTVGRWRELADGSQPLPTGAFVAAGQWLKFGQLLLERGAGVIQSTSFDHCTTGSQANPSYGLGLWLMRHGADVMGYYASGAKGQGLYVIPQRRIVAVHFAAAASWNHAAFIKRLA